MNLTHNELVQHAIAWLLRQSCGIVISEMVHSGSETPDAIGWKSQTSILVECKTSMSDLRCDKKKVFRRKNDYYNKGMGCIRYIMVPKGLLKDHDLFQTDQLFHLWGILEVNNGKVRRVLKPSPVIQPKDSKQEISLLVSAMRRKDGFTARIYEVERKCQASITKVMESDD